MSRIVPEKVQDLELGIGATADAEREEELKMKQSMDSAPDSFTFRDTKSSRFTESNTREVSTSQRYSAFHPEMTSNLGTTAWCAPELLTATNKTRYSVKVDVYSFGMVMWELWEKKRPYEELTSRFDIMDAIRSGNRPPVSDNCPPAFRALMQRCWQAEPTRRPTFKYIERYLKEELARVRRQRASISGAPSGRFSSISIDQASTAFNAIINEFGGSRASHSATPVNNNSANTAAAGADNGASTNTVDVPNPLLTQAPEGRAPLIAFERSFSYLTSKSPEGTSAFEANHIENSPMTEYWMNRPSGQQVPSIQQQQQQTQQTERQSFAGASNTPASNQWRDRYVLKFSGWQASKPDAGLPPSLQPGGGSAVKANHNDLSIYNNNNTSRFNSVPPPRHSDGGSAAPATSNLGPYLESIREKKSANSSNNSTTGTSEVDSRKHSTATGRDSELSKYTTEAEALHNSQLIEDGGLFTLDSVDGPSTTPPLRSGNLAAAASAFVNNALESAWNSSKTSRSSGSSVGGSPRFVTPIPVQNSGSGSGSLTVLPTLTTHQEKQSSPSKQT